MSFLAELERNTKKRQDDAEEAKRRSDENEKERLKNYWEQKRKEAILGLKKAIALDLGECASEVVPNIPEDLWKGRQGGFEYLLSIRIPEHNLIQRRYVQSATVYQVYGSSFVGKQENWNYQKQFKQLPETGWMVKRWSESHYNDDGTYDEQPSFSHYTYHEWRTFISETDPEVVAKKEKKGYPVFDFYLDDLGEVLVAAAEYYKK
jgi:hypothetical protein